MPPPLPEPRESGFEAGRIARFLTGNAARLDASAAKQTASVAAQSATKQHYGCASWLAHLHSGDLELSNPQLDLEDTDRTLSVLEEKLFAALLTAAPEAELVALRTQADRELAPYRGKMGAVQIRRSSSSFFRNASSKRVISPPRLFTCLMKTGTKRREREG